MCEATTCILKLGHGVTGIGNMSCIKVGYIIHETSNPDEIQFSIRRHKMRHHFWGERYLLIIPNHKITWVKAPDTCNNSGESKLGESYLSPQPSVDTKYSRK